MIPSRPRARTQSLQIRPGSPAFSTTTDVTDVRELAGRAERIITRADLRASADAYEHLLSASTKFREALGTVSRAGAGFAEAIEKCARLKGPSDACGKDFQAAAGLHHLISNHERILEHTISHKFEAPLRQGLETYKSTVAARSTAYEHALTEKSRLIRKTEADNMRVGRKKLRDLNSFRVALATLQAQVNDLDKLKSEYYQQVLEHEQYVWDGVLGNVSLVVRSTMDVYDRITAKASDPSLEHMLASVPDPFDEYASANSSSDAIFSILPPLDILTGTKTPNSDLTAPGSAASSTGKIAAPVPNSSLVGGLANAPPSTNGLKSWLDSQKDGSRSSENGGGPSSRRHSVPPIPVGETKGHSASQLRHLSYSAPLASPPILDSISESHTYENGNNQAPGTRETNTPPLDEGVWGSYSFPVRPNEHNETSEANLDGGTPVAVRFPVTRTGSDDAESEGGVTIVGDASAAK